MYVFKLQKVLKRLLSGHYFLVDKIEYEKAVWMNLKIGMDENGNENENSK